MRRLVNLDIREERFDVLKEQLLRDLRNRSKDRPFQQVYGRLMDELVSSAWPAPELIAQIEYITRDALMRWRDELFKRVSIRALVHGNVEDDKAESLKELISKHIPLAKVTDSTPLVSDILGGSEVALDIDHNDAAMILYIQDESASLGARARSALFTHMVASDYFSSLRTEQQLGYVVSAMNPVFYEQGGVGFLVQSPVAGPFQLKTQTRLFLEAQDARFAEMGEEEFDANRSGLIAKLMQRDKNLGQRAQRYWSELDRGITTFDAKQQMANMVSKLNKEDMVSYLDRIISLFDTDYLFIYSAGKLSLAH